MSGEVDAALGRLVDRLASVYETVNGRTPSKVSLEVAVRDAFENCLFLLPPGNVYTTTIPAGEISATLGHRAVRRDWPVEDEPAECCWAYVVTSWRGCFRTFDSVWLDEDAARGYANTLKDGQIAYRLPLKGGKGAEREPDWTPFDGAKPAFTNDDADMLLARLDAAEAEIKALQEEAQNARIRDQRTHGRIDGVVRRIAQGLASASDTAMKEVGK